MAEDWRDLLAADRLALDGEFEDRVREAGLSSQEWGLVMTVVEFRIEDPENPPAAELHADTGRLDAVLPEVAAMRGGAEGVPGSQRATSRGLLDGVRSVLGLDGNDELRATAETLAAEYAERLQDRLEDRERWRQVCSLAAEPD
jgi:hypothetical protein